MRWVDGWINDRWWLAKHEADNILISVVLYFIIFVITVVHKKDLWDIHIWLDQSHTLWFEPSSERIKKNKKWFFSLIMPLLDFNFSSTLFIFSYQVLFS